MLDTLHPAINQLKAFGCRTGDRIDWACIAAKGMPMDVQKKFQMAWTPPGQNHLVPINPLGYLIFDEETGGELYRERKDKAPKRYSNGLRQLERFNRKGYGVYVRPNSGGRNDSDIIRCPSLFHEFDDIPKEEQWQKVQELTEQGFEPTLVVETRKSLHIYHRITEEEVNGWQQLQQRLIQRQNSDPAIQNPARLMRLAGFKHWKWDEVFQVLDEHPVEIKLLNENIYSRQDFDRFLPTWDAQRWGEPERRESKAKRERGGASRTGTPIEFSGNPMDIRNFAHYFTGYTPMADGWVRAKCPHHSGAGDTSFRLDPISGSFKCWAGCAPRDIYKSGVELAKRAGYEFPEREYTAAKQDWEQAYEDQRRQTAKYNFTRKPDVLVKSGFFPKISLNDIPPGIVSFRGDCGTGKTYTIAKALDGWSLPIIQVGSLNSLLMNTSVRYGTEHHQAVRADEPDESAWKALSKCDRLAITDIGLAMHVNPEATYGDVPFILLLDEIEQTLESCTSNSYLSGGLRLDLRQRLEWMIKHATYIVVSDADVSDLTLNYLETVRGDGTRAYVVQHTGKMGSGRQPIRISTDKGATLQRLHADIVARLKIQVACETKADLKAFHEYLIASGVPNNKYLIIHGDNSGEEGIRQIIESIDKEYLNYDIVAYTATLGTGIDLSTPHFDRCYAFMTGDVLGATQQWQLIKRYRPDVPTEIYLPKKQKKLEIDPDQIILNLLKRDSDSSTAIAASLDDIIQAGLYPTPNRELLESDLPFLNLWANHKARKNASLANPMQSLCDRIEEAGYTLEILEEDTEERDAAKATEKAHKEIKKQLRHEEYREVAGANLLSNEEYEAVKRKPTTTLEERRSIEKTWLRNTLGLEITPEIVELDRKTNFTSAVKLLHILTTDEDVAIAHEVRDRDKNPIITDRHYRLNQRKLLSELGIPDFIKQLQEPGFHYSKDTPEVLQIATLARARAGDVQRDLGIKLCFEKKDGEFKQSSVAIVNRILKMLGLATANHKVKNASRLYHLDQNHWTTVEAVLAHLQGKTPKINLVEEPLYSWYFASCFGEFRFKAVCALPGWGVPDHIQEITHQFTNPQEAGTFHHLFVYSGSTTSSYKHNTESGGTATSYAGVEVPPLGEGFTTTITNHKTVGGGTATNYMGVGVPPLGESAGISSSNTGGRGSTTSINKPQPESGGTTTNCVGLAVPPLGGDGSTTSINKPQPESGGTATNCVGLAVPPPTPTLDREVAPLNGSTTPRYKTNNESGATPVNESSPPLGGSTTPMYISNNESGPTCDRLPLLNPGDEVEVYFYSSWSRATVLDCLLDGDFLVRVHIHLWDKTIDIYDAGSLRLPQVAASLTGATTQ